jgi:hypothetical protein
MLIKKETLIQKPRRLRPHVVILGAGASAAAFPDGDANGKKLPTMDTLIETIGIGAILERAGVKYESRNFENVYSELYEQNPDSELVKELEEEVYSYFKRLKLHDAPTLYDHLLFSLRPKDLVATFNWDPFLFDAWDRNRDVYREKYGDFLPQIAHLHGNVRIGYCLEHNVQGENGRFCPTCDNELTPSRLLYPILKKNYSDDPFIKEAWNALKDALADAFTITIFGYGAPTTDKEAVELMKHAWRDERERLIERMEVIDIKTKALLRKQWNPFVVETYFDYAANFYESRLSKYPRRTCEALIDATVFGCWVENNPIPPNASFDELFAWLAPYLEAEDNMR